MKKLTRILSLALAAVMLLSCLGALAAAYSSGLYPYYNYPYYPYYPYYNNYYSTPYYTGAYPFGYIYGGVYNGESLGGVRVTKADSPRRQVSVNERVYKVRVVSLTDREITRNTYVQPDGAGKALLFTEALMRGDGNETMLMLNCALNTTDNIGILADTKALKGLISEGVEQLGVFDSDSFAFSLSELVSAAENAAADEVLVAIRKNAKGRDDAESAVEVKNELASDVYFVDVYSNAPAGRNAIGAAVSVYPKFKVDASSSVLAFSYDDALAKHKTRVVSNPISGTNYASPCEPLSCGTFIGALNK